MSRERLWYRLEHLFARLAALCDRLSLCCYDRRRFRTGGDWTDYHGTF